MPKPLLSIVTPSLNQEQFLGECLESVAREMATPEAERLGVEHIVMDGGSTDGTVALLEQAGHVVYWQSKPDGGQSAAINRGLLDHATGRYATWLNADDWFEPGALGPMLERLSSSDPLGVLVGRCRFVRDGQTIFTPKPPEPIDATNLLRLRTKWFAGELIVQPEAFFDRQFFARIGGLNESNHFTMDHEMWLGLLEAGASFESIDHPVACMRVHAGQKTADNRRIVASLVKFGRPFLDQLPPELAEAPRREFEALERKLRLSEPVLRRLALPWSGVEPTSDLVAGDPAPPDFHVAPLRAVLADVPRARGLLRRPYRTRVVGEVPSDGLPLSISLSDAKGVDAVLFWHGLSSAANPDAQLREATSLLRPGGLVIAAAELGPCDAGLRTYCGGLASLIDQQLSQDHDWLIGPGVMPWVELMAESTDQDDAAWLGSHPHPCGFDVEACIQRAGFERIASMAYGGLSWHPLTPFVAVEGVSGRDSNAWYCGVWRKPG